MQRSKYKWHYGHFFAVCSIPICLALPACGGSTSSEVAADKREPKLSEADPELSPPICLPALESIQPQPGQAEIRVLGEKIVRIDVGTSYLDAGALALDEEDGDISANIVVNGLEALDTSRSGDYLLRYDVTDNDDNPSPSRYRIIRVTESNESRVSKRFFNEVDSVWEYFEYLPEDLGTDPNKTYPLLIVNHGWSHSKRFDAASGMKAMKGQTVVEMLESGEWDQALPFIVLVPQRCWSDVNYPQVKQLNHFVLWAESVYPVDRTRVYMTGTSMGAWATWEYMRWYPNVLAAAVPFSGGGWWPEACQFSHIPVWAFTAINDNVVPYTDVSDTVEHLRACSAAIEPKLTVFGEGGHIIDDKVFDLSYLNRGEPEFDLYDISIFTWLLQYENAER